MLRTVRVLGLGALCLVAAACDGGARKDAAADVAVFLGAAQARDRVAFEAGVDRTTLREDLRRQLTEVGRRNGVEVEGGPSDLTLDRMITPEVFHLTDDAGLPLAEPPTQAQVVRMTRVIDRRHICLEMRGACLLTFARDGKAWRLVSMPPTEVTVAIGG